MLSAWPDGGPALQQPAITVHMFDLIMGEVLDEMKRERQKASTKHG
jgi:hypothetical protein